VSHPSLRAAPAAQPDIEVFETGRGQPLVAFVHGVLDRGRSFQRVAALLEEECRMLWYDRRGYGDSLEAPGGPVDVDGHVDDLLSILAGRRATVVGHSFGGVTAVGAALRAPEVVASVVLYETGMAWVPGWDDTVLRTLLFGEEPEAAGVRLMFGDRFATMTAEQRATRLLEARAFVAEERSVRGTERPFDVAAVAAPMVFGCSENPMFLTVADHLKDVMRHVEVVDFPGAGHNAHRTRPEAFAAMVRRGIALGDGVGPLAGRN
jgi:pimeloyl-ACP methyl ester carboxylesterase